MFTEEKGIIDLIYLYSSGIQYRKLYKIIEQNFYDFKLSQKINEKITDFFIKILSKGQYKNDKLYLIINIKRLSGIISGRRGLELQLMYKHNHDHSLHNIIDKVLKDIEMNSDNIHNVMFYG